MIAAEPDWLDLRVPFDDAARQCALPLLDTAARALSVDTQRPLVVIDLGAGTGNSMRWFDHHLGDRVPDRALHWVLVDADEPALEIAAGRFGTAVRTIAAPISSLPVIAAEVLDEVLAEAGEEAGEVSAGAQPRTAPAASPHPCDLVITGSALLDVLTRDDTAAIVDTLQRFCGIGLFLLSISGRWHLSPPHPDDGVLDEAFGRHQRRDSRLGTHATTVLERQARHIGARVESSASPWHLEAPRHSEFLTRFLAERVDAAIEEDPRLASAGRAWLEDRLDRVEPQSKGEAGSSGDEAAGLSVVVDHTDVLIDATFQPGLIGEPGLTGVQRVQATGEPKR